MAIRRKRLLLVAGISAAILVAVAVTAKQGVDLTRQAQRAKEVTRAPNAHQARAELRFHDRDYAGAAVELREVVREEPSNRSALFQLAYALHHAGQTQEAKRTYMKLSAVDDSWGRAANRNLANLEAP